MAVLFHFFGKCHFANFHKTQAEEKGNPQLINSVLKSGFSVDAEEIAESCQQLAPRGGWRAICSSQHFRDQTDCVACTENCAACTEDGCGRCDAFFWLNATDALCCSYDDPTHCTAKTHSGCCSATRALW